MTTHLIESTAVLLLALLFAQLPFLAARTRFAIVFAALLKFALPSAIVPRLLSWSGITFAPLAKGTIVVAMFAPGGPSPVAAASPWPIIVTVVCAIVAIAFFTATWIRGRRAVASALRDAVDAGPRARLALARLGHDVRLLQSPSAIAPAAIGIARPVILIPDPAALRDDELDAILAHECAHVARRDNLLGIVEALFAAALWFHPLVWVARRVLAVTREEECDEAAVRARGSETVLNALAKICRAAVAPRTAGVSCIRGTTLKERMEVIMRLDARRTLPHALTLFFAAALIVAFTAGTGVLRAMPQAGSEATQRYKLDPALTRAGNQLLFAFRILDTQTGEVAYQGRVQTGVRATMMTEGDPHFSVTFTPENNRRGQWTLDVYKDDQVVEHAAGIVVPADVNPHDDGLTIHVKDADLRDLLSTFEKMANVKIDVPDYVHAKVTASTEDEPWQQALTRIVSEAGYTLTKTDDTHFTVR